MEIGDGCVDGVVFGIEKQIIGRDVRGGVSV